STETVFASKWLHFHAPRLFPLFDNKTEGAIEAIPAVRAELAKVERDFSDFCGRVSDGGAIDPRYSRYCFRLLLLRSWLAEGLGQHPDSLAPRHLDCYVFDRAG
ncbi:MAG: hypothetical protein QME96_12495, partial [Myxococcota bacterium]|nr:hypothetical protein [Myxococcota bacterium]